MEEDLSKSCPDCDKPRISFGWCKDCETNSMKENFYYWISKNKVIDGLIRHTQLNASQACDYLEWILFETLDMVKYIGEVNLIVFIQLFGWKDQGQFGMIYCKNGLKL